PADQHGAGLLVLVEAKEQIGEADDGAAAPIAAPADRLRQGVVGAMRKRVAVHGQQRTAWRGHIFLLGSIPWQLRLCVHRSKWYRTFPLWAGKPETGAPGYRTLDGAGLVSRAG